MHLLAGVEVPLPGILEGFDSVPQDKLMGYLLRLKELKKSCRTAKGGQIEVHVRFNSKFKLDFKHIMIL